MPKEDPAPIEGGALHFFATEYCAIIGTFARHGHADLPLHIADAVDALLAEVKRLRSRLNLPAGTPRVLLIGGHHAQRIGADLLSGSGPAVTRAVGMEQAIDYARHRGPFTLAVMVDVEATDEQWTTLLDLIPDSVMHNQPSAVAAADWIRERCGYPLQTPINSPNGGETAGGA